MTSDICARSLAAISSPNVELDRSETAKIILNEHNLLQVMLEAWMGLGTVTLFFSMNEIVTTGDMSSKDIRLRIYDLGR